MARRNPRLQHKATMRFPHRTVARPSVRLLCCMSGVRLGSDEPAPSTTCGCIGNVTGGQRAINEPKMSCNAREMCTTSALPQKHCGCRDMCSAKCGALISIGTFRQAKPKLELVWNPPRWIVRHPGRSFPGHGEEAPSYLLRCIPDYGALVHLRILHWM